MLLRKNHYYSDLFIYLSTMDIYHKLKGFVLSGLGVLFLFAFASCSNEKEELKKSLEEARSELESRDSVNQLLAQKVDVVYGFLDSIKLSEDNLTISLEKGTSYDTYLDKFERVKSYIDNSKEEIIRMEKSLEDAYSKSNVLSGIVKNLRRTLEEKEAAIAALNQKVEKYKEENNALIKMVDIQREELRAQEEKIKVKQSEIEDLEKKIIALVDNSKKKEADSYFTQAKTLEEMALRTKLAPKKKQKTFEEAYNLYKKAFEAGRLDAYEKMESLASKI